jgi:hypothetical protein
MIARSLLACAALALASLPAALPAHAKSKSADEVKLARDYALVVCIRHRYPGTELASEADIWARGLVERGNVAADFYGKLAGYVRGAVPAPESSQPGTPMRLKNCIDFYNSPALTKQIRKLMRE